ncbi:hypothetical protein QVD17_14316 [Tagetes erecta]|uniref:Nitrile-specifier protein 5 n=1 Tax=Tagetes erecta TaxID=13708 RepID=A0AAD8KXR6_TARER|nr:hypothetical protein QVD17_14316 [Tagetes erecta]
MATAFYINQDSVSQLNTPQNPLFRTTTMMVTQGKWIKLNQKGTGPGARSSHTITIMGEKAYSFGGEFKSRVPVDNSLHVFDLNELTWSVAEVTGDIPPPRVGVTMASIGQTIYVFGGRNAKHVELNELHSFDTCTNKWTLLSTGDTGPTQRSYHSITTDDHHVYIFGGCGVAGRLNDLWAFNVDDKTWAKFPLPGDNLKGRGGPGLVAVGGKIWVVYGFAGMEVDDVHFFDAVSAKWVEVETTGEKPTPRSVFSSVAIGKFIFVCGGEVDPSGIGHVGAGKFTREVYALDTETFVWNRVEDGYGGGDHPGARGWCAFSGGRRDGKEGLMVYGGNSPSNVRLDGVYFFTPSLV